MNTADLLRLPTRQRPDHPALLFEGRSYTYRDLDLLTDRFASYLRASRFQSGEVIALLLESRPELLIAALGAFKAGVVPNVVNAMLSPEEVRTVVANSGAALLVTDPERWADVEPVCAGLGVRDTLLTGDAFTSALAGADQRFDCLDLPPHTVACLLYTSGTTGRPKGVMLTHRNITDNASQFARVHFGPDDRLLVAAPMFHCWGLINGVFGMFAAGGTAIVVRRFKAEPILERIAADRPTQFLGVPAMVNHLIRSPSAARYDRSSLRVVHSAAAPMPAELIAALRDDWKVGYAESYGLTEVSPVITTTAPADMRPGSCGRAMGDTELKVVDVEGRTLPVGEVGELWARGTAVSAGYFGRPDATAEVFVDDGWFRTGDIVRMDADGYVFLVDRAKDMINVGGEKVYPRDVEEVLFRHKAVADVVVIGAPDPVLGEVPCAVVALKAGQTTTSEELIAFLRPCLASFKIPRDIKFVDVVPRSPSGKALRRLLR
jgi:long-chain acyl-CoA synthetase